MAAPLSKYVRSFEDYESKVKEEIEEHERMNGVKFQRFSALNALLKGLRAGEVTIFSGHTGQGKTTFLAEYSLDLCEQGVSTLWVNLEVPNETLITTLITQFAKKKLVGNSEEYKEASKEYRKLKMFHLDFCDEKQTLEKALQIITDCVAEWRIEHVVVDNLQCFLNMENTVFAGFDYLRCHDLVFGMLKSIARCHKCHVSMVIHPKKESSVKELNNSSISGTGMAIQQCDNIVLLQTTKSARYLQLSKNRFDGTKGCLSLDFDTDSRTFTLGPYE